MVNASGARHLRKPNLLKLRKPVSKESLREADGESAELKDSWTIRTIWADMLPAHFVSAAHYQTTCHQLTQAGLMVHSANMRNTELVEHGPFALQVGGPHQL